MVHKILDDKREVLLKKIDEMIEEANKARSDIWRPLGQIYTSVYDSYMSLGTTTLESIADSTPTVMEVDVNVRRIVDVKIPNSSGKDQGRWARRLFGNGLLKRTLQWTRLRAD